MKEEQNDSTENILIVDDELFIRKVLSKYLSGKKYLIDTADDGQNAIEKLDSKNFDLVITDLRMPKMGGRELLQIMSDKFPEIPKIVLTGHGTSDDIILALQTGAYDFLTKPITDFGILDHSIKRALERKRLSEERKRYLEQVNQINEIISMLNKGKSTEEIFHSLDITLRRIIPFNMLALLVINDESRVVNTRLVMPEVDSGFTPDIVFPLNDPVIENISNSRQLLSIDNIKDIKNKHSISPLIDRLLMHGLTSMLMLPLIIKNTLKGFLLLASEQPGVFAKSHISFLESIGGQISFSVERGELIEEIEKHTKNLEHLVESRTKEILKTQKTTIFALSKIAETRDQKTGDHLERIRGYSVLLAQILKYTGTEEITSQFIRDLYDSSILHDIGKVGIPDGVLLKEGYLTPEEFKVMENHAAIGYDALRSASHDLGDDSFLKMALDITRYHHERWDGSGYPQGLKGEEIPLSARIVAIADVYDALTTSRPYKSAFAHERAIEIIKNESHKFDPQLIRLFIDNADEFNEIRQSFESNQREAS